MATDKQIAANRANAQCSTGPQTVAGKAVVGRNALRHGLRSKALVLPDEDEAAFEALRESLIGDMAPDGMLEMVLVERMAVLLWRVARASRMESAAMAYERALRLHTVACEVARQREPEPPDWEQEDIRAKREAGWADWPPPEIDARMAERGRRYVADVERHDRLCEERNNMWFENRTPEMVGAGTFHKMLTEPQLLENLARYEVGLYRQFEAVLSQFWMVRANRAAERRDPAPVAEIIDQAPDDDASGG